MVAGAFEVGVEADQATSWLKRQFSAAITAQEGRAFLWSPIGLTVGIWIYFSLMAEPGPIALGLAVAAAAIGTWFGRSRPLLMFSALVAAGFAIAAARTHLIATPLIRASTAELQIQGIVEDASFTSNRRMAVILAPGSIEDFAPDRLPRKLRLTASNRLELPAIGSHLQLKARLLPLPSPVIPGGFDYGRQLYFDSIGGTGRISTPYQVVPGKVPLHLRLDAAVEKMRQLIGVKIRQQLSGVNAAFAEALITGERSTIPKEVNQSLITSGLYHILSISGLHMWLVAGGMFWIIRAALAAFPRLALRHPIKKWAAAAALVSGFLYMLLAQSSVATQRSYIMIAVAFFAVLVDRPAISVRNLALAAIIILVMEPEAATEASFQMSFLAVMGLAAYYEFWAERQRLKERELRQGQGAVTKALRSLMAFCAASLVTTLIAGATSSIPAAYHFGRLAPYGLVANALALPAISLIVMPAALCGTLLIPFGLEAWPFWAMGKGLELVMVISDWVAGFPGARALVPQVSALSAIVMAAGAVWLCLVAGPTRLAGIIVLLTGLAISRGAQPPDILVESTAGNVAIRNASGELVPALSSRGRFAVEKWLLAEGDVAKPSEAAKRKGWTCEPGRCSAMVAGKSVVFIQESPGGKPDCSGADILIANFPLRGSCRSVETRIDRIDVWKHGAYALRLGVNGITIETSHGMAGARSWVVVPEPRKKQ